MLATVRSVLKYLNRRLSSWHSFENTKLLASRTVTDNAEVLWSTDLECNLSARRRTPVMDLSKMKELHRIYRKASSRRQCIKKLTECNPYELRQYQSLDVYLKHLRLTVLPFLLTLPNKLDERTPRGNEDTVILTRTYDVPVDIEDHVSIGRRLNVLRYEDKVTYYLENDAAKLEIAVVRFLTNILKNERKFKPFKNPDICNSFVTEGVVVDQLPKHGFHLFDSYLMLTGGASLTSFCAVRVETSTHKKFMPEHFFTCARHYIPDLDSNGLFGVCQRTDISIFEASSKAEQMWSGFDANLRWMIELYESFGLDFRVCFKNAASLTLAECCRATIQLYSSYENKFIDAARLSVYDTFVSNRLKILSHNAQRDRSLVYIIDGVVVSVPSLIACLLERSTDRLFIPDCIRPFMPK